MNQTEVPPVISRALENFQATLTHLDGGKHSEAIRQQVKDCLYYWFSLLVDFQVHQMSELAGTADQTIDQFHFTLAQLHIVKLQLLGLSLPPEVYFSLNQLSEWSIMPVDRRNYYPAEQMNRKKNALEAAMTIFANRNALDSDRLDQVKAQIIEDEIRANQSR